MTERARGCASTSVYSGAFKTGRLKKNDTQVVSLVRGRTGFDSLFEAQAACRGWFVGLVNNRTKTNKCRSPRSRSRGLIDRDVRRWTPATAPDMDSRLA